MAPTGRSKRWQVWSLDPQSRRWMVVDEGREQAARASAERKMGLAWKHGMIGAAYVALPPGEQPAAEHCNLAVIEDEAVSPGTRLSGEALLPPPTGQTPRGTARAAHLSLAGAAPVEVERFASGAFDGTVGRVIPVRFGGQIVHWARVKDANVSDDGLTVCLTLEAASGPNEGDGER